MTRAQLFGLGCTRRWIDGQLESGWLRALHRGVYLVGPITGRHTAEMAAVLACEPDAFLSHHSAGHLWQLLPYLPKPRRQHVTVAARNPRRRPGIEIHRVTELPSNERIAKHAIPSTTPARTLLDLAGRLTDEHLEQAIAESFALHLTNTVKLFTLIAAHEGHRGTARLRRMLEREPARTRSRTERRLLSAIRAAGLPEPEVNVKLGPWEIDFLWRDAGLAVELDGYDSHSSPRAFARDYRKNAALEGYGLEVTRVSAEQARDDTAATVVRIGRALSRSARGRDPGRGLRYQS